MEIWPAIDLRNGKCVRLRQGNYNAETIFSGDPVAVAVRWQEEGAQHLHLVDLDGARDVNSTNRQVIREIVHSVSMQCEVGGGVRRREDLRDFFDMGVGRVIIGTKAVEQPDWFASVCQEFSGQVVLGVDARDGLVATHGWEQTSARRAVDLCRELEHLPLAAIIYTDIETDGMLQGPNLSAMRELQSAVGVPVVASGGVSTLADIQALAAIPMAGVIIGRALYEERISLREALSTVAIASSEPD